MASPLKKKEMKPVAPTLTIQKGNNISGIHVWCGLGNDFMMKLKDKRDSWSENMC